MALELLSKEARCQKCKTPIELSPKGRNRKYCKECSYKLKCQRAKNSYYKSLGTQIRNICIKKRHSIFIKKTHLNLSRFIQEKLDKEMQKRDG